MRARLRLTEQQLKKHAAEVARLESRCRRWHDLKNLPPLLVDRHRAHMEIGRRWTPAEHMVHAVINRGLSGYGGAPGCILTIDQISQKSGYSRAAVFRALDRLEEDRAVRRIPRYREREWTCRRGIPRKRRRLSSIYVRGDQRLWWTYEETMRGLRGLAAAAAAERQRHRSHLRSHLKPSQCETATCLERAAPEGLAARSCKQENNSSCRAPPGPLPGECSGENESATRTDPGAGTAPYCSPRAPEEIAALQALAKLALQGLADGEPG